MSALAWEGAEGEDYCLEETRDGLQVPPVHLRATIAAPPAFVVMRIRRIILEFTSGSPRIR